MWKHFTSLAKDSFQDYSFVPGHIVKAHMKHLQTHKSNNFFLIYEDLETYNPNVKRENRNDPYNNKRSRNDQRTFRQLRNETPRTLKCAYLAQKHYC